MDALFWVYIRILQTLSTTKVSVTMHMVFLTTLFYTERMMIEHMYNRYAITVKTLAASVRTT